MAHLNRDGRIVRWYGSLVDIQDRRSAEEALRESEAFARGVLECSPDITRVLDLGGRLLFMNRAGYRSLELESDAAIDSLTWERIAAPEYEDRIKAGLAATLAGQSTRVTFHRIKKDGSVQWLDTVTSPIPGTDGRPTRMLSISRDITAPIEAQAAIERARREAESAAARLSSVLESTMDGVLVLDLEWRLTYANHHALRMLELPASRLGESIWTIFPAEATSMFAEHYRTALATQVPVAFEEYFGSLNLWLEVNAYPSSGSLSVFFRDITIRRKAEQEWLVAKEEIAHLARHDPLTGLPNRLLFRERLEQALANRQFGTKIAVLSLGLGGLVTVNDTLGHCAGDLFLQCITERLQDSTRNSDTVARFDGDEFGIIQTSLNQPDDAGKLADRIVDAMGQPFDLNGQQVLISASVGVAVSPLDGTEPDELLKAASVARYTAKFDGRGACIFYKPGMHESLRARQLIRTALSQALPQGQLELHYQPIVCLSTGEVNCFEALLRWRHPERGMVSPEDFIPVAEEAGLIVAMGEWALREACSQAASWPNQVSIAVNLSVVQFRSAGLVEMVGKALADTGLQPGRLQLEITESLLLHNSTRNLKLLQGLRALGTRIAMDDFGTGYSSLSYLQSFPFDKIKLDRIFVRALPNGKEARAISRAVAGLGGALGITTTAEGIETQEQLVALRNNGYNEGQGYLFSKPVTAADIPGLIGSCRILETGPACHSADN